MAKMIPAGQYIVRFPNPHYSQLKNRECWWEWANPYIESTDLQLASAPWDYPDMTDLGIVDQQKRNLGIIAAKARYLDTPEAANGISFLAKDGNVYQAIVVWKDLPMWSDACGFVAKAWDGVGDDEALEAAFHNGKTFEPYTETDAAVDAAKSTAKKAAEVAAAAPQAAADALDQAASVTPWWVKALAGVAAVTGLAYAWDQFGPRPKKGKS